MSMKKDILEKVDQLTKRGNIPLDINVDCFNDPLATKIDWRPLKKGGVNFQAEIMEESGNNGLLIKSSLKSILLKSIVPLFGLVFLIGGPWKYFAKGSDSIVDLLFPTSIGLAMVIVGVILIRNALKSIMIDGENSCITLKNGEKIEFKNIHAFQILEEYVKDKKRESNARNSTSVDYWSYELNIVLKNGERVNLMDHSEFDVLRRDASKVAGLIKAPIWDSTDENAKTPLAG